MKRTSKADVMGRLEYLNKVVGADYTADYAPHYGGWEMYLNNGKHSRGALGFDYRKSTAEFMSYMTGVINATLAIKNQY